MEEKIKMKTAVMYGAGNIGRGFIGQVLHDSGYEVVFIDVDPDIVSTLNRCGYYTQLLVDGEEFESRKIDQVRAISGLDTEAVIYEIASCEIMAVAIGAAVLPRIAMNIANGIKLRKNTLNILVCENLHNAPSVLRDLVKSHIGDEELLKNVGFVGTTIGRMVPVMPNTLRKGDPTRIAVERYCKLPLDVDAIVGDCPEIKYAEFCRQFSFHEDKKLYIHNMGHALTAYLGYTYGYEFIWQAVADQRISVKTKTAMSETAVALAMKYNQNEEELRLYVDDLIGRFANKGLKDTVARVGGDPLRKLAREDRLVGALQLCKSQGVKYSAILDGIAAALNFDIQIDASAVKLQEKIAECGAVSFLVDYCALEHEDAVLCAERLSKAKDFSTPC